MNWFPNSYAPLREFNQCHEPGGTASGGQFCSGGLAVIGPGQIFDFHTLGVRRFMFNSYTGHLILGRKLRDHLAQKVDAAAAGAAASHAEEFGHAQQMSPGLGKYDDYIKGWVFTMGDGTRTIDLYPNEGTYLKGGKDNPRVAKEEAAFGAIKRFVNAGAGPAVLVTIPWHGGAKRLDTVYPELVPKQRMQRMRAA